MTSLCTGKLYFIVAVFFYGMGLHDACDRKDLFSLIVIVVDREFSICIFCSSICFHYLWGLFSDARAQSRTFGRGV